MTIVEVTTDGKREHEEDEKSQEKQYVEDLTHFFLSKSCFFVTLPGSPSGKVLKHTRGVDIFIEVGISEHSYSVAKENIILYHNAISRCDDTVYSTMANELEHKKLSHIPLDAHVYVRYDQAGA